MLGSIVPNFGLDKYDKLMPVLKEVSFDDLVTAVRRQSQVSMKPGHHTRARAH